MSESDPSDNSLQPFIQNLGLEQLETVRALSGSGGHVEVHLHHHSTVVKGDVVRGSKTDVKNSEFQTLSVSNEDNSLPGPSQPQALSEPLAQAALPWADGKEQDAEVSESDDEMVEHVDRTPETISSARMRMPVKRGSGTQTNMPDTFDTESQTVKTIFGESMAQTNEQLRFDTEAQTDNPRTRDRRLQTDDNMTDSDSQTLLKIPQRSNAYVQTAEKVSSDTDVQTEILELTTNQTQTQIRSYQENEFQTDKAETLDANSQTNKQTLLHIVIMEGLTVTPDDDKSALKMIKLYNTEKTEQDVGDLLPLLETIWKSIQIKIVLKSIVRQLASRSKIQLDDIPEQKLSTFISRVGDVIKIGEHFDSENNFIHAVISFYIAAILYKLGNKSTNSMTGILVCIRLVRSVVREMTKHPGMKNIVIDHVIPLMHEMKSNIQSIQGLSRNISAEFEAWCLCYIGNCYDFCGEYQQYANMNESAVELMKRQLKNEAAKYRVYGSCFHNAGAAYHKLGQFELSIEKYKISLKTYKKANDWINSEEKNKAIVAIKRYLNTARSKV